MNRRLSTILTAAIVASVAAAISLQAQAQMATSFSGVIDVTLNIAIGALTPVPQGDSVICSATVTTTDLSGASFSASAEGTATLSGATAATCTLTIPYLWPLTTQGEDRVSVSYVVSVLPATAGTNGNPNVRSASGFNVASFPVPNNNATTKLAFPTKI